MSLKQSSRGVVFVPADQSSVRITKTIEALNQQDASSNDVWMTSIIDRYIARSEREEFEHLCLATLPANTKLLKDLQINLVKREIQRILQLVYSDFLITKGPLEEETHQQ